jgi:hypothetical protein
MKKKEKKPDARAASRDALRIVVLTKENPRRSETARKLFDLYAKCKTVGEYREAARKITPHHSAHHAENIGHGYIELRAAGGAAKTKKAKQPKALKHSEPGTATETAEQAHE